MRGLKRSLSAAGLGDEDRDVDPTDPEVAKERADTWRQILAVARKWGTLTALKAEHLTKDTLDQWWARQKPAVEFAGKAGESHRVFLLSGELWALETGDAPWHEETEAIPSLTVVLDWLLDRTAATDTLVVFDGRSAAIRKVMEERISRAYQPRRASVRTPTIFGSRNREVGWVSFPISRTHISMQARRGVCGSEWEKSTFSGTYSGVQPLHWAQLPSISAADKQAILGRNCLLYTSDAADE